MIESSSKLVFLDILLWPAVLRGKFRSPWQKRTGIQLTLFVLQFPIMSFLHIFPIKIFVGCSSLSQGFSVRARLSGFHRYCYRVGRGDDDVSLGEHRRTLATL